METILFQYLNQTVTVSRSNKLDFDVQQPFAYMVHEDDLNRLRDLREQQGLEEIVLTAKRSGRARAIIPKKTIPILRAHYKGLATLRNGVKKIFRNIGNKKGKQAFILYASSELFQELWDSLDEKNSTKKSPLKRPDDSAPNVFVSTASRQAKIFLDLMEGKIPEPSDLVRRYHGEDYTCQLVRQLILRAAREDCPILILGERGTGKEIVANAIHDFSPRGKNTQGHDRPFRVLNCAAVSPYLFEVILFGCKRDYPNKGLPERTGLFREADSGTLFLDEIGEMPPEHQAKLLRAVQFGKILPVGYSQEQEVNVRVIAATNRDISDARQNFRTDLFDRLSIMQITTPSLRSHIGDLELLAQSIWRDITGDQRAKLQGETLDVLRKHEWEGNVRELKNRLKELHSILGKPDNAAKMAAILSRSHRSPEVNIQLQDPANMQVPVDLFDIMDVLAEASHETWKRKREQEGWTWGPKRVETDLEKRNPDLLPYIELSEQQKSYAREEAKTVVRTLLMRGYMIERR